MRRRLQGSLNARFISASDGWPRGAHDHPDRLRIPLPLRELGGELTTPEWRQLVVLRLAIVLGVAPIGVQPSALLEAMERGIKRALLDLQPILRDVLDPAQDAKSVHGTPAQGLEDDEV